MTSPYSNWLLLWKSPKTNCIVRMTWCKMSWILPIYISHIWVLFEWTTIYLMSCFLWSPDQNLLILTSRSYILSIFAPFWSQKHIVCFKDAFYFTFIIPYTSYSIWSTSNNSITTILHYYKLINFKIEITFH